MTTGTALVPVETLTPAIFATKESADDILTKLRAAAAAQVNGFDISTDEGRKAIASAAYAVARTKTAIDKMGQELVAETKRKVKAFDQERARIWDGCEAIQSEVRKPLTEWEESEKARVAAHEARIGDIVGLTAFVTMLPTTSEITDRLAALLTIANAEYDWQEFRDRAARTAKDTKATLERLFAEAKAREDAAAEAERKRQEAAAEAQRQREARIAADAAENAKREAEEKAAAERRRIEESAAAEQRRLQAEVDAATRKADAEAGARQRAEQQAARAAEVERQQIEAEKRREAEEATKREANRTHRAKVQREATAAIRTVSRSEITDALSESIFEAIADGLIPHVKVEW